MPTTIPLASRYANPELMEGATAKTLNLDFVVVAAFAVAGLSLALAFAALFPISADMAFLMASVN
jgi:hypothetical protein